ncbi:hypothetical protein MTO96_022195 [Rhipicephalus appendiculatus]
MKPGAPQDASSPLQKQGVVAKPWQCRTPELSSSTFSSQGATTPQQTAAVTSWENSRIAPELQPSQLSAVSTPSGTVTPGSALYQTNFEQSSSFSQSESSSLQGTPVAASQAQNMFTRYEVFYPANAPFQTPVRYYAVPTDMVAVQVPSSTPQFRNTTTTTSNSSISESMIMTAETDVGYLGTCLLVSALGLLMGLLLFFFVFRLGLSAVKGHETTTEAVRVGIVFQPAASPPVCRLPRHGREELRDSNRSALATVFALVTTEDALDNEVAGATIAVPTSKETARQLAGNG